MAAALPVTRKESSTSGNGSRTVAWNRCVAVRLPISVAVTVIVAVPFARAVTDTVLPSARAVATSSFEDWAS